MTDLDGVLVPCVELIASELILQCCAAFREHAIRMCCDCDAVGLQRPSTICARLQCRRLASLPVLGKALCFAVLLNIVI